MPEFKITETQGRHLQDGDVLVTSDHEVGEDFTPNQLDKVVTVTTKDLGRTYVHVYNADGKRFLKARLDDVVRVARPFPTEAEKAEQRAAEMVRWMETSNQWLHEILLDALQNTPQKRLAALASTEDGFGLLDSWKVQELLTHQASYDYARRVQGRLERWAEQGRHESLAPLSDVPDVLLSFAMETWNARRDSTPNPLSRSTSTVSNLLDDLKRYVAAEGGPAQSSFHNHMIKSIVRRLENVDEERW